MITQQAIEEFKKLKTPFYYYDMDLLRRTLELYCEQTEKFGYKAHYAVKANSDRRILALIREFGLGIDCVSGGEVALALESGFNPESIVFAGVAKTDEEILLGLKAGIGCFNCESIQEIERIDELAWENGCTARIAVRVNPDIDAKTHRYISTGSEEDKFGISRHMFPELVKTIKSSQNIKFTGIHLHVGSQITDMGVFRQTCLRALEIEKQFEDAGFFVSNINLGGGLGVDYQSPVGNPFPRFKEYFETVSAALPAKEGRQVHFEPGRALVAQCGDLVARVIYVKKGLDKKFVILDAGMNDLIRPALYGAHHEVENLSSNGGPLRYDVVGPVCESSDVWDTNVLLPATSRGDLFAIHTAGAYGQVMAMRYNCREFAPSYYSDTISNQSRNQ